MWRISIVQDPAEMDDPTKHFRHDTLNNNSPGLIRLIELLTIFLLSVLTLKNPPAYYALSG